MSDQSNHFWANAPHISWFVYLKRRLFQESCKPSILPINNQLIPKMPSQAQICKSEFAKEYSEFLRKFFSNSHENYQVIIPVDILQEYLSKKHWIGTEVRDSSKNLIGLILCKNSGMLANTTIEIGSVSWLCVHPQWRKRGITNLLLRSIYASVITEFQPAKYALLFWKEGYPLHLPPILIERMYGRSTRKYGKRFALQRVSGELQKKSLQQVQENSWKLIPGLSSVLQEVQTYQYTSANGIESYISIQPMYEVDKLTGFHSAEIVNWQTSTRQSSDSFLFESMIDSLPSHFQYIYCSHIYPFLESTGWKSHGIKTWYGFHLDPGFPLPSAIYTTTAI